jgi:hypothetical protein
MFTGFKDFTQAAEWLIPIAKNYRKETKPGDGNPD